MDPKWGFRVLSKVWAPKFSDFLHGIRAAYRIKVDVNDFLEKNFFLKFLDLKRPEMSLK